MQRIIEKKRGNWQKAITIFLAFCSSVAFFISFEHPVTDWETSSDVAEAFKNVALSLNEKYFSCTVLFAGLAVIYLQLNEKHKKIKALFPVSCCLAVVWLFSNSYYLNSSLELLYDSCGQVVKSTLYFIGMAAFIYYAYSAFYLLLFCNRKGNLVGEKSFFKYLIIIMLIWLPHVVISYPANMFGDSWYSLCMAWGMRPKTATNPVAISLLISGFSKLGNFLFHSIPAGLFMYIVSQYIVVSAVMAYILSKLQNELQAPNWLMISILALFTFSTYFANMVSVLMKDVPYSVFFALLVTELALMTKSDTFFKNIQHRFLLPIAIAGVCLCRNNGKLILMPTVLAFTVYLIKKKQIKNSVWIILPLVVSIMANAAMTKLGGYEKGATTEALCIPMQQVSRIVAFHGDELSEEQIGKLKELCDYDRLSTSYFALNSDPAKVSFNRWMTKEQKTDFLKLWLELSADYPVTSISAILNQNFPLLYPFLQNSGVFVGTVLESIYYDDAEMLGIENFEPFTLARERMAMWHNLMASLPVTGVVCQQAIYNLLLIGLLVFNATTKFRRFSVVSLPVSIAAIGNIFAPLIQYSPRYVFPVVYSIPILIAYYSYLLKENNTT